MFDSDIYYVIIFDYDDSVVQKSKMLFRPLFDSL